MDHTVAVGAKDGEIGSYVVGYYHSLPEGRYWAEVMRLDISLTHRPVALPKVDCARLTSAPVVSLCSLCGNRIAFNPKVHSIPAQFSERLWRLLLAAGVCLGLCIQTATERQRAVRLKGGP